MNLKPKIAGIGELLWDVLPTEKHLGGAPFNFAFHARQAGCESYVISAIGKDALGKELKNALYELDFSTEYIQENNFPTSTVTIVLDDRGHPSYTIHENVAWDYIRYNKEMNLLAKELDAVCFGSLAQRSPESQNSILTLISDLKPECLKTFDINLRQNYYSKGAILKSIEFADILKLNENELPVVAGYLGLNGNVDRQLETLVSQFQLKYVIYTKGGDGSIVKGTTETSYLNAPKILVSDSVGAGDSFTAVFIAGLLKGIPLKETHFKATEIAAFVCTQKGATPKLTFTVF